MLCLRIGMVCAVVAGLYVAGASFIAGYAPEVATLRGVLAWLTVACIGYLAELIVATAPMQTARREQAPSPGRAAETQAAIDDVEAEAA